MGHIVLDLTSLTYQPATKLSDRSGDQQSHAIFAMSVGKPAYRARSRSKKDDHEDFAPLVPPRPPKPPQAAQRQKKKGPPIWQDSTAILEQEVSRDSKERAEETSILSKKAEGEALRNIINKLSDERNLKDLHLKHDHMPTAQFKKRTTHLDIPGRIYDLYQYVVETCPFCNSIKPRPERSRVSGLCAEEFGDLIFLDHGSAKIEGKTFGFLIVLDGATSHLTDIHAGELLHQKQFQNFMNGWIHSR